MGTYSIIAKTDSYIAGRDPLFKGKTSITIGSSLSLEDAKAKLLDMYNGMYDGERPYAETWEQAVDDSSSYVFGANSFSDGTCSFEYDNRTFTIVEE